MEREFPRERQPQQAYLTPPNQSHLGDYTVNLEGYSVSSGTHIPKVLIDELQQELGNTWSVANRGTRIEITHASEYGKRDDFVVMDAVEKILKPKGYTLELS